MAFHYSFPEKVAHPAQRIHCLCGSAMQLKNGSPLFFKGRKLQTKKGLLLPFHKRFRSSPYQSSDFIPLPSKKTDAKGASAQDQQENGC